MMEFLLGDDKSEHCRCWSNGEIVVEGGSCRLQHASPSCSVILYSRNALQTSSPCLPRCLKIVQEWLMMEFLLFVLLTFPYSTSCCPNPHDATDFMPFSARMDSVHHMICNAGK
jgi:hypothetical protein